MKANTPEHVYADKCVIYRHFSISYVTSAQILRIRNDAANCTKFNILAVHVSNGTIQTAIS